LEIKIALNEGIGLEQVIKCTNDTTKNAVRLCDDCDLPFCTECLRKNLMGFYYCQWCYPALFKDTSAPEYEIPIDEKGLMKLQSEIQVEVKKIDNNKNKIIRQTISGGACGFGLSFLMLLTGIYLFFPIITILGLMTGFIISYKEKESKNVKILKQIINGGAYGVIFAFLILIFEYITMPSGADSSNFGFLFIIIPPITIFGMILGFLLGVRGKREGTPIE
jgi:hypothetical protein